MDSSARTDLHEFFERLVPEDEDYYTHTAEGSDDTTSHLRMVLDEYHAQRRVDSLSGSHRRFIMYIGHFNRGGIRGYAGCFRS